MKTSRFLSSCLLSLSIVGWSGCSAPPTESSMPVMPPPSELSFPSFPSFPVGAALTSIVRGDWNQDGKLDLAVAVSSEDRVSVLLGDGRGKFTPGTSIAVGQEPLSVAVGDLNGDGRLDLAVANRGSSSVSVHLGDGRGGFTLAGVVPVDGMLWQMVLGDA